MPTANGYLNPANIIAPDIAVQQAQIQRQQELADALRQQSLQPVDPGRGQVSWTQGLAKLAGALAAKSIQKKTDASSIALNQRYADALRGQFGAAPSATPGGPAPSATPGGPAPSATPGGPVPSATPGGPVPSATPDGPAPTATPGGPAPASTPPQRGPWSLTGDPQRDMAAYMLNPEKYGEMVIAQNAPTDFNKSLQQAGIDPNSAIGRQIQQSQLAKQNYIAPENSRGNSWTRDPMTGEMRYNPGLPEGSELIFDANGRVVGSRMIDGVVASVAQLAGAKAGAEAAAKSPYDLVEVVDPTTGAKYQVPKSTLTGGAGGPPPGGAPGGLNAYYGRGGASGGPAPSAPSIGNQSSLGPQAQTAATQAGKNSADGFNAAIQGGVDAKNAMRTIDNIAHAARGLPTGTGAGVISDIKSGANAALGAIGLAPRFDTSSVAKFDEMKKSAATLGAQLAASASGSSGVTDARLGNALASLPGAHYSPAAIQEVSANLKGLQAAALGRSQAAAVWQQQRGPGDFAAFQSTWQRAYNPDIFYHMQKGAADFQRWSGTLAPAERARVLGQYRQMKSMGAF